MGCLPRGGKNLIFAAGARERKKRGEGKNEEKKRKGKKREKKRTLISAI